AIVESICPATFAIDGKWGMVNSHGEIVIEPEYDWIKPDANGFCFIGLDGKEGFIAPTGVVIEPVYDSVEIGPDEYIVVTLGDKKGYVDEFDEFTEERSEAYYNYLMCI
ncbi:MAG: WG repeat-containing protein, partial [Duncaniella sp.]|nr:WG repeat-containing protein [Duncaniella sp.]